MHGVAEEAEVEHHDFLGIARALKPSLGIGCRHLFMLDAHRFVHPNQPPAPAGLKGY